MNRLGYLAVAAIAGFSLLSAPKASAQVSFGVQIGAEPACPYGYYDYAPYQCAPYGYYGPEWFSSGMFIGAGPWYHGHEHFRGHVDRHFDPHYGYHGDYPARGEHGDWDRHHGTVEHFKGHDMREERPHDDHGDHHDDHSRH